MCPSAVESLLARAGSTAHRGRRSVSVSRLPCPEVALLDPELRRDLGIVAPHLLDEPLGVLRGESC